MNGTQLKALQGVRLPESDAEWGAVRETLDGVASWLKVESSPELFLSELKELAAYAHDWWENRTKREGKRLAFTSKSRSCRLGLLARMSQRLPSTSLRLPVSPDDCYLQDPQARASEWAQVGEGCPASGMLAVDLWISSTV